MTAGLILAAGESRRMGTPKALLRYRDESFLDTLIGRFETRCSPVIVVLGAAARQVRAATSRAAAFVENVRWESGQTSSMQCGLRDVPAEAEGVLFTLVDHPAVRMETIDALLDASAGASDEPGKLKHAPPGTNRCGGRRSESGALVRVPRYQGRNGHPIWFSRGLIAEFLALAESGAAREVVRAHIAETEFMDVDDAGVLADIDDPAAYRALIEAQP
ncbi:MAG: nucleotidyltransferase family protein [Bryobacteraceae bacterium]